MSRPARLLFLASALSLPWLTPVRGCPPTADRHGDPLPAGALARLGTVRLRHAGPIYALSWSPDGRFLVSGDGGTYFYRGLGWAGQGDAVIRSWDLTTGQELRRLVGAKGVIRTLSFGGKYLLSVGDDFRPRLWDFTSGVEVPVPAALGKVRSAALSPDGKSLAAGSQGMVRLFDLRSGNEVRRFAVGKADVLTVLFSPDGQVLAATFYGNGNDRGLRLWDVATGRQRGELPPAACGTAAFSADSKVLATAAYNLPVKIWDPVTGKIIRTLGGPGGEFGWSVAFAPDGKALLAVRPGGAVLWDVATGKELRRFGEKWLRPLAAALSPDGKRLALSDGHAVRLFETDTGKERPPSAAPRGMVEAVAFSPDGKAALTAGAGVQMWETASGKQLASLVPGSQVGAAVFAPDSKSVVAGCSPEQVIRVLDAVSGKELRRSEGNAGHVEFLGLLGASPSVVSWSQYHSVRRPTPMSRRDMSLRLWDLATGKQTRTVGSEMMHRATCSPDGRRLAGGMHKIGVWDAASGREVARLDQPGSVFALAFTPDGRRLVSSEFARPLRVWEVATGTEIGRLAGHDGATLALTVSPDGRAVASGGSDGTVRLWDLETGKELRRFKGHQGAVLAVAFSPDGRRLLSGSRDTTGLIWDVTGALPAPPALRLTAKELEQLGLTLASADGAAALRAVRRLALAPEQALPHLRAALDKGPAVAPGRLARLLADLDADDFKKREAASAELARLGKLAEAALKQARENQPSLEVRRRVEAILKKLDDRVSPAELHTLRAVEVLELIGTPEARQVIESVARNAPTARAGEEAKAALERLTRREGRH